MKKILAILTFLILIPLTTALIVQDAKGPDLLFQMGPLIEGPSSDGGPHILQDSSCKIWVFFVSDRIDPPYRHIFYITSIDGGLTWAEPSLFVPAYLQGVDQGPVTAFQDSTGRFWVAWTNYWGVHDEDEIWFTTSSDGENWADARALLRHGNKIGSFIEADGKIWFFFSPRWPNYFHASYITTVDGGNTWTELVEITSSYDSYPHVIVLSNGTIFVVYNHYPYTIGYASSSDGGLTWSNTLFNNPEYDSVPSAIEYGGKIYVFFRRLYQEYLPPSDIWFRVYDETGWGPFQQMTNDPQNFDNGPIPALINNQIWIVWDRGDLGAQLDIWLAKMFLSINANIDIDPDTLNLKSNGQWITVYITLPGGYSAEDIVLETVYLDGIPAAWSEIQNGVYMVKFDRATVQTYLTNEPDYESAPKFYDLTLTITGELVAGTRFEGTDTITVIKK